MVEPLIIPRPKHNVSRDLIDPEILKVLYRLKQHDHDAYVVGGAIRDILRGEHPKDFDIATDATPSELRKIFRNSRIVGRRFRLVHVVFGSTAVEVATLRRAVEFDPDQDEDLYIEDDNAWGDVESDAFRRDFTINALFYDIRDFAVIDYCGGVEDLKKGLIRSIGDPWTRLREDPVRMLRAIKFAARFGFTIEADTDAAMRELPDEIHNASRFRVTEEIFRILTQRNRDRGFALLREYGFLQALYPEWLHDCGEDGLDQVQDFFERVEEEAREGRFLPVELVAAGMFLPLLGTVDVAGDSYGNCSAAL
nr:polynucleotide adenylyltransferase PcnB [Planctomycetota bacterium]